MHIQHVLVEMKARMAATEAAAIDPAAATVTSTAAPAAPQEPKKKSGRSREGTMVRTIKVDFDQSADLSDLISRHMDQQRWAFNMAVKEKLDDPRTTKFDLNNMLTGWRDANRWLVHDEDALVARRKEACSCMVQRAGLLQGLDAVKKFMISNGRKRRNKSLWKYLARLDREKGGIPNIDTTPNLPSNKWSNKRNRWSHRDDLFKRKGKQQSLSMFRCPVYKGNGLLHLPGIGTVKVHGDVGGLDMRSFQLVETTKRTTRRTKDYHRTYRLHIQVGIEVPKPTTSKVIRGVDMGIVHGAATADLGTSHPTFYDLPKDCRRAKGDDISRMYSELSRKRGGRGNRRIRQYGKEGGGSNGADGGNNTSGKNRNKLRKPKSRSYKELQRKISKKRERLANRQTNWERHASKGIADGVGTVAMEDLNLNNMTAKGKGNGSSAKTGLNREMAYSRPGTFQRQIMGACENAGVTVIMVDPKGTSTTCHKCGRADGNSRVSQARFHCTNDNCDNDINADINAAYNIATKATAKAAGRPGWSSEGARSQRGIAPARSANSTREPSVGGNARAPAKGKSAVCTFVYNSLLDRRYGMEYCLDHMNFHSDGKPA